MRKRGFSGPTRNSDRRIEILDRDRKALELRKAGANYAQIAREIGLDTESGAAKAVKAALDDVIREPAMDVLVLELSRLDVLLLGCWQKAKNGDVQAIDRALRIMERRAAYLGIDAPKKTATDFDGSVTVTNGAHEELLARIAMLTITAAKSPSDPQLEPGGGI
jgi:hypothetical protein